MIDQAPLPAVHNPANEAVLHVRGLTIDFAAGKSCVRTVHGFDLDLKKGETVALLGESGSGKTITMRALMRLLPPTAQIGGRILIAGQDVLALPPDKLAELRGRTISMVFQDPGLAFDPVFTVGRQIAETIVRHEGVAWRMAEARALNLFERVGIPSPAQRLKAYPHELSGGMRQRAMIALALACRPQILLADEPTTALDATVQIQVLLLLRELQRELGLAVVFVTHDIGVAVEVADRIAVMYAGRIVEIGAARAIIRSPQHPYTKALLSIRMAHDGTEKRLAAIPGSPPDPASPLPGCAFGARCAQVMAVCGSEVPALTELGAGHQVRCWLSDPGRSSRAHAPSHE